MKNNNGNFELSEISSYLILCGYTYYTSGRFYKYDFDEWLLKEFEAIRDENGKVVDLRREYTNGWNQPDYVNLRFYGYNKSFKTLYDNAKTNEQ